jgi:hypothetical protein
MPVFVADETILVPGLLRRGTPAHRLLIVCAYGRLRRFAQFGGSQQPLSAQLVPGGEPLAGLAADDGSRAALLSDRLPPGTPHDCLLVTSTWIMRDVGRALRSERVGALFGSTDEDVALYQAAALSLAVTAIALRDDAPQYTGHTKLDGLLETAFESGAAFVLSENPAIVRYHDDEDEYSRGSDDVRVMRLSRFVTLHLYEPGGFDLDAVDRDERDANLLEIAFARLRPLGAPQPRAPRPVPATRQPSSRPSWWTRLRANLRQIF